MDIEGIYIILGITLSILVFYIIYNNKRNKIIMNNINTILTKDDVELRYKINLMKIEYDKKITEEIKTVILDKCRFKLRKFIEENHYQFITRGIVAKLIEDTATEIYNLINLNNLDLVNSIYKKQYFEQLIIDYTLMSVYLLLTENQILIKEEKGE